MGCFDDIQFEVPLSDLGIVPVKQQHFQTKSLDCFQNRFTVTSEGRLVVHEHDCDYHGDVLFYGWVDVEPKEYRYYTARFTEGTLVWIRVEEGWK